MESFMSIWKQMDRSQGRISVRKVGLFCIYALLAITLLSIQGCVSNPSNSNSKVDDSKLIAKSKSLPFLGLPSPKSVDEALNNGDQAYGEADFDRALFEYVRALDLEDKNPLIYVKIGKTHVKMQNDVVAHFAFQEGLKIDSEHISALESMGGLLLRNNKLPEAKSYLQKAISIYEGGTAQVDTEKTKTVVEFPLSAYTSMGIAMDMENDTQKAIDYYFKALDKAPYNYSIINNIGYSYYLSGAWTEAERYYSRAIEVNNKYALAWKNLGLLYARQDRFMESMNAFEQVMEKPKAYNDIGYICLMDGKYEEAEIFLSKAIDSNTRYYKMAEQNLEKVQWHKRLSAAEKTDSDKAKPKRVVYQPKRIKKPIAQKASIPLNNSVPVAPQKVIKAEAVKSTVPKPETKTEPKPQPLSLKKTVEAEPTSISTVSSDETLELGQVVTTGPAAISLPSGSEVSETNLREHWRDKKNASYEDE